MNDKGRYNALFQAHRPIELWSLDESPDFRFVEVADIYSDDI
jgi:hypothetical protein